MSVDQEVRPGTPARRRYLLAALPVVVVLVLAGLTRCGTALRTSSPGELPWTAGQRHVVADPGPSDTYLAALLVGTLSEVSPGQDPACLVVTAADGRRTDVVWPHGYRLSATGLVLRGDGSTAARVGAPVRLVGGDLGGPPPPGNPCPPGDEWWDAGG